MPPKKPEPTFDIPGPDNSESSSPTPNHDMSGIPRFHNPQANTQQRQGHSMTVNHPNAEPVVQSGELRESKQTELEPKPTSTQVAAPLAVESEKRTKARAKLAKLRKHKHLKTIRFAIICFVVFLVVFNFQFIYSQVLYLFTPKQSTPTQVQQPTTHSAPTTATPAAQPAEVVGPENVIIIPKIKVNAPLIFIDTLNERDILTALQGGVVHYAGTANPGENGNSTFFGHSSNDWWEKGNYKFVFVLLEKLVPGDQYEIHYQSRRYVYQVESTKTVDPTDLSVLNQTPTPYSTLITCTPPGTSWKRFVVLGKQISPAPVAPTQEVATSTPVASQNQPSVLPSAAPSIFEQLKIALSNFFGVFKKSEDQPDSNQQNQPTNHLPEVTTERKMPSTF